MWLVLFVLQVLLTPFAHIDWATDKLFDPAGFALLECVRGCTCHPREYSFTHPYGTSITSWRILTPTLDPGASHCTAKITVLNRSMHTPPEYKVKLNSIMVTEEKGFTM